MTKHISREQALYNGRKFLAGLSGKGITGGDVTLAKAHHLLEQAINMIASCPSDGPLPTRILRKLPEEAISAVLRTMLFKAPDGRKRALEEIQFRLDVVETLMREAGFDVGDTVE